MSWIYPATAVAYVVLGLAWAYMEIRKKRGRLAVGAIAIAFAAPFFTAVGAFLGSFQDNICYSEVIGTIADLPGTYVRGGNTQKLSELEGLRGKLPLHGYETSCEEVRSAVEKLK